MNKYHARKTKIDGITFDSLAEARRYSELVLIQKAGDISNLEVHPRFEVWRSACDKIVYEPDFMYIDHGKTVCEDVKGVQTREFRMKAKMFRAAWPNIELRIVEA